MTDYIHPLSFSFRRMSARPAGPPISSRSKPGLPAMGRLDGHTFTLHGVPHCPGEAGDQRVVLPDGRGQLAQVTALPEAAPILDVRLMPQVPVTVTVSAWAVPAIGTGAGRMASDCFTALALNHRPC
jgi:hypothetical protein